MDDNKYGFTDQMEGLGVPPMSSTEMSDTDKRKEALSRRPGLRSFSEAKGQVSQEELLAGVDNAASFLVPFYDAGVNVSNVIEEYMKPEDQRNYDYINEELGKAGTSAATEAAMMLAGFGAIKYGGKAYKALKNKVGEYEIDPSTASAFGVGAIKKKAPVIKEGVPTIEAAGLTDEAIEAWRKKNKTSDEFRKSLKGRNTELQELAKGVSEGRVFSTTYRKRADEIRPINVVKEVPKPATNKEIVSALNDKQRRNPIIGLNERVSTGEMVDVRLNIPAYTDYDVWVPTIRHNGKEKYKAAVRLKNVNFIKPTLSGSAKRTDSSKALKVAEGGEKNPFAVMTGEYVEGTDNEIFDMAKEVFDSSEWTQVGYDPIKRGFFYDRETGQAILEADEVIQVGHLVLARNAKKTDPEVFPFNEGGAVMKEQMEMAFMNEGGVPDNTVGVDPVSGNDIPVGSTAEEVRDDIPAMLSEGEYVVPADVVKYHGLALFEALRDQAKFGLREMAEDGRIGGEPIEGEMDEELTAEDQQLLQEIMTMEDDGVVKAAYGTFIPGNTSTTVPSTQVQMPTSGQTPASTQQAQLTTTQQDPSGVYGIVTGTGQPVTSSTPLVNQQPVVQGVVGTAPVTGDSTTTPGTTETGMVTKKYVAPDCRQIDVLTLNGKIISSTPADFDVFVEATEANLKRFNCITSDEEITTDDTTTTLTGDDGGTNEPEIKTTSDPKFDTTTDQGSRDAADYFKEKSGVSVVDPFKAAQDALNNALNADTMKGAGALAGLLLGPVGTLGAGVINAGSQIDALSTAYANKSMADYLGKTEVSNSIQKAIDEFLGKAPGVVKFVDKSSDLGKKKMEYALLSAQSVNAPDDMALTEDRFGSSDAFNSAMNEVATAGMSYNADEKVYQRTTETVQVPTTGGGSVTVGAGTQASTASAATVDRDTGRVVFTPGEKTVRPVLRPGSGGSESSDTGPVGVVGNNDTGQNSLAQSIANFFTPGDDKEYVGGVLVDTSSDSGSGGGDSGGGGSSSSGGGGGCCFIMLEARYGNGTMDEVVRRYRDEYMTDRNRRGYYKTAEVLVPLMRKSKVFKWVVTKTFADPLVSYGKYYYGENKHGVIFTPVKNFWMKLFDVVGGDTEFIRENGEVV